MKSAKSHLLKSALAMLLCISMLVSSTFAWFTDKVSTKNNIITSGNLDLEMYWTDDLASGAWYNVEEEAYNTIFSYENWEPGYTEVKYIKLVNAGDLALNYDLAIEAQNGVGKLAEVISVYYGEGAIPMTGRADLDQLGCIGFLNNVMNGGATASGTLLPADEQSPFHPSGEVGMTIAMSMITTAGNEYQNESSGDFTVRALATQAPYESDSFGSDYDASAELPTVLRPGSVSTPVTPEDGKVPAGGVTMAGDGLSAFVPEGTVLADGADKLTLTVTPLEDTTSGIVAVNDEILIPVDVHIDGVAENNTVPIVIDLGAVLPKYLNMGNYRLIHVEDGVNQEMTRVSAKADLTAHNQFTYDPATGEVSVAMASFSEVALVAEPAAWEGEVDHSWYMGKTSPYTIVNADQLWSFSQIVGGMAKDENGDYLITYTDSDGDEHHNDTFSGKIVTLVSNINLGDIEKENNPDVIFYPIGYWNSEGTYEKSGTAISSGFYTFQGTFDGNGNTISNFYQNTWEMKGDHDWYAAADQHYRDGMGLFGRVSGGTVKNLTVSNFSCDSEIGTTGVIAAYADSTNGKPALFENIAIKNCNPRVYNIGNGGIVGCAGWYSRNESLGNDGYSNAVTFRNITADQTNMMSALWGSWGVSCAGILGQYYPDSKCGIKMENCHVAAIIDVNNDVCSNYQYYWYRYAGMFIGTIRANTTEGGYTVADTTGVSATGCTYTMGNWNEYWYCEIVANSLASYTHDHQFSRLTNIYDLSEIKSGDTWLKEGHFALLDENRDIVDCYHIFKNSAGKLYRHFHDVADESNPNIYETFDLNGDGVLNDLKEDRQRYFIPFNQLLTGLDMGIKAHTEFDGIEFVENGTTKSVEKFQATANTEIPEDGKVNIGDLFTATGYGSIVSPTVQVFVSPVGEESTVRATYSANSADWNKGTLSFSGTGSAKVVITDYYYCTETSLNVTVGGIVTALEKFETKFNNPSFLYRVGSNAAGNTVALGTMFKKKDGVTVDDATVTVTITSTVGNASGVYTANETEWEKGAIAFTGTGVVKVTISALGAADLILNLEVVDAKNVTTASFSGNCVLLKDVSTSNALSTSGIIYGNGFTVNMENAPITEKNGAVFHLYDGAILKNLNIVGKEFTTVAMNVNDTNYGVSAVRAWGTVTIEDCYISGCRAAVSVTGSELTIKNSTIANGVYANIDFRSGILNLHNVTTINEPHSVNGTTIVGLGIVGNMTASAGRQINISGTLTQYNWVSQEDCSNIKATGINSIFNSVYTDAKYASLRYTYNGTTYVNTGILSLSSDFVGNAVAGIPSNYVGMDVTGTISNVTVDGYVWAPGKAGTLTADDMKYHNTQYNPGINDQGTSYIPSAFDYEGAGLEVENNVVQISYESGSAYTLTNDTLKKLLVPSKYGQELPCKISMNGVDYTDSDITFNDTTTKTYTITYTITDNLVFDQDGNLTNITYEVKKDLKVFATVVDKKADAPTFTFYYGTKGSASAGTPHTTQPTNSYESTIKQISGAYYIMPNVSATSANAIGSQTVDGTTVYYPIVDGINVRSGSSTDYDFTRYYPVFKAVKISDNGTEFTYSGTKEMPATVQWTSATIDSGNGASALNDGFGLYNSQYLCKIQKKAGDAESGGTSVVKYSYTALDGNTYSYYVGYRFYDEDEGGLCVTPDTLITLADGSQVRVDALTGNEQLLVWNHATGKLESAPVAYIVDHDKVVQRNKIAQLFFADGTDIKIIGEHVFYDVSLNKYVTITTENAQEFVGHRFISLNANGDALQQVRLTGVKVFYEETTTYEVVSYEHLTCFTNGVLSASAYMDKLLNIFDITEETMAYNADSVRNDIEKYGLYTYADFEGLISEEAFNLYNAKYLKIAVGKGYIDWNDILDLIDIFFNVNVQPLQ